MATLFVCSCFMPAVTVWADAIPYSKYGTVAPVVPLTARSTGHVTGYFFGSDAGGTDYVRLVDATSGATSAFLLNNHASLPGAAVDFGFVTAGDVLVFQLVNAEVENNKDGKDFTHEGDPFDPNAQANSYLMASAPAYSIDVYNHAYVTSFSGDPKLEIPSGVYLGMEDLPFAASDFDYNDVEFVFTNVASTAMTPEPGSLSLLGTGTLGLLVGVRRRRASF